MQHDNEGDDVRCDECSDRRNKGLPSLVPAAGILSNSLPPFTGRKSGLFQAYVAFMGILVPLALDEALLGIMMFRTPFLKLADALSASVSTARGIMRLKDP